ncbi:MAG: DUF3034 family protein [Kiritimatiellae bacterium]|nr:DUF3034 family protein [Kiritimatiellia bacterium]
MNKIKHAAAALAASAALSLAAGVPLNNLQGTGGIAFNPLAYTAGQPWESGGTNSLNGIVSKPQVGAWYVNLNQKSINWYAAGFAFTVLERLELSAGYGYVNAHKYGALIDRDTRHINTYNVGAKLKILDENAFDTPFLPAIAVGGVYKYTDSPTVKALKLDNEGVDGYIVATKLITQTPWPILLSAGLLVSDEVVNGVIGHNHYGAAAFGNIDILPASNVAIGLEYKQGIDAGDGIRNHDYFDAHVAWFVTEKLTLVAAFAETGDPDKFYRDGSAKDLGVGSGLVLSAQYQF